MDDSILNTVKKFVGVEGIDEFDPDLIIFINSVLMTLRQLGLNNLVIEDDGASWDDLLVDDADKLQAVQNYICTKVRLMFDPPTSSHVMDAMERWCRELEWRLNITVDPEWGDA